MSPIKIPENWSPEQAMAAIDLLGECCNAIWAAYETPLVELILREQHQRRAEELQPPADLAAVEEFDDDIPF